MSLVLIRPNWPAPAQVAAFTTTREGGSSIEPFDSFNLAAHVGDDPAAVAGNRRLLVDASPGLSAVSWLEQVHGVTLVSADPARVQTADTQFTRESGLACAVLTADCLPVLFCDRAGTQVAAAHAGWRGLCDGVLEQTVASFAEAGEVLAWLGPAISQPNFEVGAEVRARFLDMAPVQQRDAVAECFAPVAHRSEHFLADLYALARLRLRAVGVTTILGGGLCSYADTSHFYSYRRAAITGRMASLIYLIPDASLA